MRWLWLALLLAGCAAAVPAATRAPTCRRALRSGETVPSAQLGAFHFLSPEVGVGLTTSESYCASRLRGEPVLLAVTRDGGRRWVTEGRPLRQPPPGIHVEQLAASSPRSVWVSSGVGPLWATTDGGSDWTVQPVPEPVVALSITRKTLWALGCPHTINVRCRPALARKLLPNGRWRRIPLPRLLASAPPGLAVPNPRTIVVDAGPYGTTRLAISTDGGRRWRFSAPRWMGRPCNGFGLSAAGPADWWVICLGNAGAGSSTKGVLHTIDGGRTWRIASQVTSFTARAHPGALTLAEPNAMAAGSPTRLWLALQNGLSESEDTGRTWAYVRGVDPEGLPAAFDVLSPTRAWLIATGHGLWRTTDGRHWRRL